MEKKHQVHNLIILDESGSMEPIKKTIIQGFNEIVQTVKGIEKEFPEQEHFISLISFNGLGSKLLHFIDPVGKLDQIDAQRYNPDASTPLYDAMGMGITKLMQVLNGKTDYNVLVTILTDGEENASREYTGRQIKELIEKLKNNHWTFTYIGTDHDVEKFAGSISIFNSMRFAKDEAGIKTMFENEKSSRFAYSNKIKLKLNTSGGFYDRPKE
jgi:uncharacterized protein YegL